MGAFATQAAFWYRSDVFRHQTAPCYPGAYKWPEFYIFPHTAQMSYVLYNTDANVHADCNHYTFEYSEFVLWSWKSYFYGHSLDLPYCLWMAELIVISFHCFKYCLSCLNLLQKSDQHFKYKYCTLSSQQLWRMQELKNRIFISILYNKVYTRNFDTVCNINFLSFVCFDYAIPQYSVYMYQF